MKDRRRKGIILNRAEATIRGSFVNLFLTFFIMILIAIGAFIKEIRENLVAMETLIIGFYGISFGVWRAGKYLNNRNSPGEKEEWEKKEIKEES